MDRLTSATAILVVFLLMWLMAGCVHTVKPRPIVCGWPDPMYFTRGADAIVLCFEGEFPTRAPLKPYHCVSVREVRRQLGTQLAE